MLGYHPVPVAELSTGSAVCAAGGDSGSSATLDCTVEGSANPYSVAGTRVWFEWGATCALGSETAKQALASVTEAVPVHATVAGLRPDSAFCYRLAGDDANVLAPEQLTGEKQELKQLPSVPPRVIGAPSVSFVHSSSAVMFGELNPENAHTEYAFEYGACEDLDQCSTGTHTAVLASNAYGRIGATLEATGLRPGTVYRYRLHAINEAGEQGECFEGGEGGCEGSFTTAPAPVLTATTEGATAVGATSAVISGSVDPDGQLATYAFELGVYQGAATQFGVVQSGSTETVPVTETLPLSGLQPGTEYAYRITITSGYGTASVNRWCSRPADCRRCWLSPPRWRCSRSPTLRSLRRWPRPSPRPPRRSRRTQKRVKVKTRSRSVRVTACPASSDAGKERARRNSRFQLS